MPESILELKNVSYVYPDGTEALKKVNLKIPKGKKIVFLGHNGAGKSTLFLQMNGLLQPTEGEVYYAGKPISYKKKEIMALRKNVSIVFQDPEIQLFAASVYQEISIGPRNFGFSVQETKTAVEKAMLAVDVTHLKDKAPHLLSYGQKKSVSIADILAIDPEVIILDEPTAWLDPKHKKETMDLLESLNQDGRTLIVSTHDVDLAYSWADYVFVIKGGNVLKEGLVEEVLTKKEILSAAALEVPWIVEVSEKITEKYDVEFSRLPRTREELFAYL